MRGSVVIPSEEEITIVEQPDGSQLLTDGDDNTYVWPARGDYPRLEIDPRIDLCKPIWEQSVKLRAKDKAAAAKEAKRKATAA